MNYDTLFYLLLALIFFASLYAIFIPVRLLKRFNHTDYYCTKDKCAKCGRKACENAGVLAV